MGFTINSLVTDIPQTICGFTVSARHYDIFTKSGVASFAGVRAMKVWPGKYVVLEVVVTPLGYAASLLGHGNRIPPPQFTE
jgi:hypothetical protein